MADKDTLYIDIDDDITAIIDKVTSAHHKIVALVLPKRAAAMHSLVNMKLLKRASDEAGKNLVLITSEAGLMPLAGAAELHVAATPTSKPAVPKLPDSEDLPEEVEEESTVDDEDFDARSSENKPIGEVAGLGAATSAAGDDDTIELDNSESTPPLTTAKPRKGKNKKLKVPNFKKFRLGLVLAALGVICLIVFFYFATQVWPHATVKIYTDQQKLPLNFTARLDSNASAVDPATQTIPAVPKTDSEGYSQTVPATGQKDEGDRASGSVSMSVCVTSPSGFSDVPAGTGVSTNNLTYITQGDAHFHPTFQACNGGVVAESDSVAIVAQNAGDNYNVNNATFSVSGHPDVTATGQASGGTSNIARVVQQSDIDKAKHQLKDSDEAAIKQKLISQLKQLDLMPIEDTFKALPSNVDTSADVGDKADNVTVTENVTYVMFGVKQNDLKALIKANAKQQLDSGQGVLDTGITDASYQLSGKPSSKSANLGINTTAIIGPKLDADALKKQVMGKRAGEIRSDLSSKRGVNKVEVDLSPFWVGSAPKDSSKITIDFQKTNGD